MILAPAGTDRADVAGVLDALGAQSRAPDRVVLAGLDEPCERAARDHALADRLGDRLTVHPRPAAEAGRWGLVEDVRTALPVDHRHWWWFLAPDSRPEPGALAALGAAPRRSSRVGVVGPKLVHGPDGARLLRPVGHHLTVAGRATDDHPDLVDQGQSDLRQDVLGVPLVGALVSSEVLEHAGGLDPAFAEDGVDGLDLSWRAHLTGHRVVVAPDAVVHQGETGLGVVEPLRTRRRRRQLALARGSCWSAPWRGLGVLVTSTLAALALLLVKRPDAAAGEWADIRGVLSPARGWGARRRFRRRRSVRPRDLAGLHEPAGSGWRATLDTVGEALDPRSRRRPERVVTTGAVATGPVSEAFVDAAGEQPGRRGRWSWPLVLAVLAAIVLTVVAWRDLLGHLAPTGTGLIGAELGVAGTDAGGLWSSALDGWRGGGLGHDRPPEAWLLPAAALAAVAGLLGAGAGSAGTALAWLLALAAPAAVLTAYLGLRRATRHRWLRAGLALGWAGLAPLTAAVADGRVGPVVVHVLAPLLVAGYAVCAARGGGARRTAAAFATALGVAVAAQWVPLVLVLSVLGGAGLLVLGRGSARWRGVMLAVLPWLLVLPWVWGVRSDLLRLAGGAGASLATPGLPTGALPWQLMLLHPGAPVDPGGLSALPMWLTAPLWAAALAALLLRGRAGRRAGLLVAVALVCLALAVVLTRAGLGVLPDGHPEEGLVVTAWPGTLLSLAGAALLLAGGLGLGRMIEARTPGRPRPRPVLLGAAAAVLVALPLAALTVVPLLPGGSPGGSPSWSLRPAPAALPAVAGEQAAGPTAVRTLVLRPGGDDVAWGDASGGTVTGPAPVVVVDLVGSEPEPGRILRDRTGELSADGTDEAALEAVRELVADADPQDVSYAVRDLGVGYVLLESGEEHPLATRVDRVTGLVRVSSPPDQVLWRLAAGEPGRLHLRDADGDVLRQVDVHGPHSRTSVALTDVPEGAWLTAAEGPGWAGAAVVHIDGRGAPVRTVGGDAPREVTVGVELPAGEHELTIDLRRPLLPWHLGSLALLLVTAFLALPFGRADDEPRGER